MLRLFLILALGASAMSALADDAAPTPPAPAAAPESPKITIEARGTDLRDLVHSVFSQAKTEYVLDQSVKGYVFLLLRDATLEHAMQVIGDSAGVQFVLKDGVYVVSARPKAAPAPEIMVKAPVVDYLSKLVTIDVSRVPIADVFKSLSSQTGASLALDPDVPAYRVSMAIKAKSLKYALTALANAAPLAYVSSSDGSVRIRVKAGASVENSKSISPAAPKPQRRDCSRCHKTAAAGWRWCPWCGLQL